MSVQLGAAPVDVPAASSSLALSELYRWVHASSELVKTLDSDEPVQAVHEAVAQQARALLGLDMTAVMIADVANRQLVVVGSAGLSPAYIHALQAETPLLVCPAGSAAPSPSVDAYLSKRVVAIPDIEMSSEMQPWRAMALREGYRSLIASPLDEGDRVGGVLVGYSINKRRFTQTQIDLLSLFSAHVGTALRAARLRGGLQVTIDKLHSANEALNRQRRSLQQTDRQHRRLMQVMANNVGVPGVVNMLAELLDASVTLADTDGTVIASAAQGAYISPARSREGRAQAVQRALDKVAEQRSGSIEVERGQSASNRMWIAPVTLSGQVVAHLWVARPDRAKGDLDRRGLERFALALALEIAKQRNVQQIRLGLSRDLVRDLLEENVESQRDALLDRAAAMEHDLTLPHRLLVVRMDKGTRDQTRPDLADLVDMAMRRRGWAGLVGGDTHEAVVLAREAPAALRQLADSLRGEVRRLSSGHTASVAIGDVVCDIGLLRGHYRAAHGSLLLSAERNKDTVIEVAELGVASLLLSHGDPVAVSSFAHLVLGPLFAREPKRAEELIGTLRCWIESDCSTTRTAERLVVHANTVLYRLKTIEDALGQSLRSPTFLVKVGLALTINQVSAVGATPATVGRHKD
jgi:sugar diacid utilization regulator